MDNASHPALAIELTEVTPPGGTRRPDALLIESSEPVHLTTLESLVAKGYLLVPSANLTVRAPTVVIAGMLTVPGRDVTIAAKWIRFDPVGTACGIDTSGPDGDDRSGTAVERQDAARRGPDSFVSLCWPLPDWDTQKDVPAVRGTDGDPGAPGKAGGKGSPAGRIHLVAELITAAKAAEIVLVAAGGHGGAAGRGGDGQRGGDGGHGADGSPCGFMSLGHTEATAGADGGDGGEGGRGGDGGNGGDGGEIVVEIVRSTRTGGSSPRFSMRAPGGVGGPGARGGAGGGGGVGGRGGQPLRGVAPVRDEADIPPLPPRLAGGREGQRARDGADGVDGGNGRERAGRLEVTSDVARLARMLSPRFLEMLVHHAERTFIAAGVPKSANDSNFAAARLELEWIVFLGKAAQEAAGVAAIVDAGLALALSTAATSAAAWLDLMQLARDRFGHAFDHVPRLSMADHQRDFLGWMKALEAAEAEHAAVGVRLRQLDDRQAVAVQTLGRLGEERRLIQPEVDAGLRELHALLDRLVSDDALIQEARTHLTDEVARLQLSIKSMVDIDLSQVFQTLESLAFLPAGEAVPMTMWLSQAGKGGQSLTSGAMVHFGPRQGSAEDYVLRALAPLPETVQTLSAAYEVVNGAIALTDKGASLVLATGAQLDNLLQPLWANATAQQLRLSFQHFKDAVLARNRTILEFNGCLSRHLAAKAALAARAQETDRVAANLAKQEVDGRQTHHVFDALGRAVERRQHQALSGIFDLARAYRAWAIEPDALALLTWDRALPLSAHALQARYDDLHARVQQVMERRAASPKRIPGDADHGSGIWFYLDESNAPAIIRQLRTLGAATLSIPAARRADTYTETPFHGLAEVRLLAFRPFIGGVRVAGDRVTVRFEHGGHEEIVSRDDDVISVSHGRVVDIFKFRTDWENGLRATRETWRQLRREGHANAGSDGEALRAPDPYAGLSPFTQWRIEVPSGDNEGLDLSSVHCLAIECHVMYSAFTSAV